MKALRSYPVVIEPQGSVRVAEDANGRDHVVFRAGIRTSRGTAVRTVRAFGPVACEIARRAKTGARISARIAYDRFLGEDGRRSQTVRVVEMQCDAKQSAA